jgi:GT2 family glycosyltransferase
MSPRLTVVILNYNGRHLLETLLPSVRDQRYRDFRVVVVDNGSADGSPAWLRDSWPEVEVVALAENIGVTRALNVCAHSADSELVALLNNDLELDPGALGALVEAMDADPEAGSAAPKLCDFRERGVIDGAGDLFLWRGHGHRRGHGERDRGQYDQPGEIFGACGGASVYRRVALQSVGGFDESFGAYFEDVDWSLRAQLAGWRCRYVPSAVVFHMGSATLGRELNDFTRYHLWRNGIWVVLKGLPVATLLRHAPELLTGQAINLAAAWWDRKLEVWWHAVRDALAALPRVLGERRRIQRARRVTPRELEARIEARPPAGAPAALAPNQSRRARA